VFVFLEFAFWCKVSAVAPARSPAKAALLLAEARRGCGHPISPARRRQRASVVASKGLNVGNGGENYSCFLLLLAGTVGVKPVTFIGTS